MQKHQEAKAQIYQELTKILSSRILELTEAIASIKESRDNESKSSAGDKYETGRAMMQIELDKNETQLLKTVAAKRELSQINLQQAYTRVAFGSLVITNQENYFIAIGHGKIDINNENYYAISLSSPIGQALKNQPVGEKVLFQGREIHIQHIF